MLRTKSTATHTIINKDERMPKATPKFRPKWLGGNKKDMPTRPEVTPKPWLGQTESGSFTGYAKKNKQFYNSKAWKLIRRQALERDDYLCQHCLPRITEARVVDHIVPINAPGGKGKGKELSLDNLQSLCVSCNARKTRFDRTDI